jgi:hypothetical protein
VVRLVGAGQWGSKARGLAAYTLNTEAEIAQIKVVEYRLANRRSALQAKAEHLRTYLAMNMKASGIRELKAEDNSFVAKLYLNRDVSVALDETATFPSALCAPPAPASPSKTKIREALERGEIVAGARLIHRDRLTIK